uniref:Solute carrier family 25 member 42 n=1 Tax=Pipistrellus kuhlii TaxID=59472 RepID=A0A7J7UAM8_PIPKU|nr:solute carrier family 25 member 42 [Pipistrellus kuhlii]
MVFTYYLTSSIYSFLGQLFAVRNNAVTATLAPAPTGSSGCDTDTGEKWLQLLHATLPSPSVQWASNTSSENPWTIPLSTHNEE